MKKIFQAILVFVIVLGIMFIQAPQTAQAVVPAPEPSTPQSGIAEGSWNTGTEVKVDLTAAPAPAWLQLLTYGVKIDAPTTICHPFRGGQYGWVGEIRQLVEGQWVKIETTNDWVPDKEGKFMACAAAPAAGTYALFGSYQGPKESGQSLPECAFEYDGFDEDYGFLGFNPYSKEMTIGFDIIDDGIPVGSTLKYTIIHVNPSGAISSGDLSGSSTVVMAPWGPIGVFGPIQYSSEDGPIFTVRVVFTSLGCYKDLTYYSEDVS